MSKHKLIHNIQLFQYFSINVDFNEIIAPLILFIFSIFLTNKFCFSSLLSEPSFINFTIVIYQITIVISSLFWRSLRGILASLMNIYKIEKNGLEWTPWCDLLSNTNLLINLLTFDIFKDKDRLNEINDYICNLNDDVLNNKISLIE